jgi:hypothetical protein
MVIDDDHHVDGLRLHLWTAATNGRTGHPQVIHKHGEPSLLPKFCSANLRLTVVQEKMIAKFPDLQHTLAVFLKGATKIGTCSTAFQTHCVCNWTSSWISFVKFIYYLSVCPATTSTWRNALNTFAYSQCPRNRSLRLMLASHFSGILYTTVLMKRIFNL